MHYITFGKRENPVVVFLHGWGGSVDSFYLVAKTIAFLGFYAVVVDFAGFGKTPEPTEPKTIESYADDVEQLIKNLKLNNVSVVGHSFGGRVGIILGSRRLVDKLVLVDSAGIVPKRGIIYKIKVRRYKRLKNKVKKGKASPDKLEKFGSSDYRGLSPVMKSTFVNVVNKDLTGCLSDITSKTLIVWGKRDKDTPLYMARIMKRRIKNSRLILYDAGHYSYLENMDKFVEDIVEFLA